jgi:hypothetical protein
MIIGIAGAAGSGKGTAAAVLKESGFVHGKFANALKDMLRALLRYRGVREDQLERFIEGDLKEVPTDYLSGKSPRVAMQTLGGEWGRDCMGQDFWVETEFDSKSGAKDLVFDDLRHDNEEEAILKHGGVVIQLIGRGGINSDHESEQFVPKNPIAVIENTGTVEELREKVKQFACDISWALAA